MSAHPHSTRTEILEKVSHLLEQSDSFAAMDLIESEGEPEEVALIYSNLVRDLYGKKKDVSGMILIGRGGIRYCQIQAALADNQGEFAKKMLGIAKAMSYNLSVNAWPGWNEGAVINRSDSLAGLDAARTNLRLANELQRDASIVGNAHWLLGAQLIALSRYPAAMEQFDLAAAKFQEAEKPDFRQMAIGYQGITQQLADPKNPAGDRQFKQAVAALQAMESDDAKFFASQLESVAAFFLTPAAE